MSSKDNSPTVYVIAMNDHANQHSSMLDKANAAFEQAAVKVLERARQTKTPVVIWEDGQVKEVLPDALADLIEIAPDDIRAWEPPEKPRKTRTTRKKKEDI